MTAGCIGGFNDKSAADPNASTPETTITTEKAFWNASDEPDSDHSVFLLNESDEEQTVHVWVVRRESGETIFEETRTLNAGSGGTLYNLKKAESEGIEAFEICGELVDVPETKTGIQTTTADESNTTTDNADAMFSDETTETESNSRRCITIRTSKCYGNAELTVRSDESLDIVYSIC
ncbi:hypothetical protein GCM10009000_052920 [Halobacterium noricense]